MRWEFMRLTKGRHTKLDINMTPMIDVTFLLLIFFMTVNQVSKLQREQLALPLLSGSQDQSQQALVVNVDQAGQIVVATNTVTLPELIGIVSAELARVNNDPNLITVLLRADRRGTCRTVNQVVVALVRLDIHRVRLAVESAP
jgi:biopolymer transport protein ExbD